MPRTAPIPRSLATALIAAGLLAFPPPRPAEAQEGGKPIDLMILVDVSASMFNSNGDLNGPPNGNDPQRIRWDAVLLAIDLLSENDRLLIVPFNDQVPARTANQAVLGNLPAEFVPVRDAKGLTAAGDDVRNKVQGFIQGGNSDSGATSLLKALETARKKIEGLDIGENRSRFVILLTDGQESALRQPRVSYPNDIANKPVGLDAPWDTMAAKDGVYPEILKESKIKKWLIDECREFSERHTKVFTFGLGTDLDDDLLKRIAEWTGGHFETAATNQVLFDKFRDMIWGLKGYWTRTEEIPARTPAKSLPDRMKGIRDVGVIAHKIVPEKPPRTYEGSPGDFVITWFGAVGDRLEIKDRFTRKDELSYSFMRYSDPTPAPGAVLPDRLETSWQVSDRDRRLDFSKRTLWPLFDPLKFDGPISRYVPLTVRVVMNQKGTGFSDDMFELKLNVETAEEPDKPPTTLVGGVELAFDATTNSFTRTIDPSTLKGRGGDTDHYSFRVTAKGKPDAKYEKSALRGYSLRLPAVDVEVDNVLDWDGAEVQVKDGQTIAVAKGERSLGGGDGETVKLKPVLRSSRKPLLGREGMPPMEFQASLLVAPKQGNVELKDIGIVSTTANLTLRGGGENQDKLPAALRLKPIVGRDLESSFGLGLPKTVPKGVYSGGWLLFTPTQAGPRIPPLYVYFKSVATAPKVSLNREPPIALVPEPDGRAAHSQDLQVKLEGYPGPLKVVIPKEAAGFTPSEELWLRRQGDPNDSKGKPKELDLKSSSETFQVAFRPSTKYKPGYYSFQLQISGFPDHYEFDPKTAKVEVDLGGPTIEPIEPEDRTIRVQKGLDHQPAQIQVNLKRDERYARADQSAIVRDVSLRFLDDRSGLPSYPSFLFREKEGAPAVPVSTLGFEPRKRSLHLEATAQPNPGFLPIDIDATQAECGTYTLENGVLMAEETRSVPWKAVVEVNDLEVLDARGKPLPRDIVYFPIKGHPLKLEIRIATARGTLLPEKVQVRMKKGQKFHDTKTGTPNPKLGPKLTLKQTKPNGGPGVAFDLEFDAPGESFAPSLGEIEIFYPLPNPSKTSNALDLSKTYNVTVQTVEILKAKK